MSERDAPMLPPESRADADPIARLVRLAGSRPAVPPERALRAEAAVRTAWRGAVAARRRRVAGAWAAGLALAAALAVAVGLAWRGAATPAPGPFVGTVERVAGRVELIDADGASRPLLAGERLGGGVAIATGGEGRVAVRLPSGASLRVDVDSGVALASPGQLRLRRGGLYVDSQGGAAVVVETPWGTVEERGTQFEVRLTGEAVRVRVREGGVALAGAAGAWEAARGEELVLTAAGALSRGSVPFHGEAWSWVEDIAPSFELEGRTLGELLAWFGRETGLDVTWSDPAAEQRAAPIVLHGSVDALSPEEALAAVLPTCGLAHRVDGGTVILFAQRP